METITRLSRNLLILLVGLVLLFSLSCSEDPSSPKKDAEDPIPQDVVTIGIEGGTVVKGDITITIPAGAFDGNYDIAVVEVVDDTFGTNAVSSSFIITGLPSGYIKPIKIAAKYTGELTGLSYLAVGKLNYDFISEDSSIVYELFGASDSAGNIISLIPGSTSQLFFSKISVDDEKDIFVKFLTSYSSTETENFTFNFPSDTNPQAIAKLGVIFERAFTINNEGLQMPLVDEERIVNIVESKTESPLTYSRKSKVTNYNIPLEAVNNEKYDKLQVAAQIYLFFRSCDYNLHWMTSSISYWLKDLVSDNPDYLYPAETFLENAMEPFNGFGLKESSKLKEHALGISGIIKYLTKLETFGLKGIGSLYKENSSEDKATLLLNNSGSQISQWFPDFFEKYINGEIYDIPIDYFLEQTQHEWNIDDENDNLKIFESSDFLIKNYPDLSAKLFKINLNFADIDASQDMLFSVKGPVTEFGLSLVIFGIQNGNAFHLGTLDAQDFEISNLKDYYDSDMHQFLICLVNSTITSDDYLGESDIDLTIKVTPKIEIELPTYNKCKISLDFIISEHWEYTNASPTDITKKFSLVQLI